MTKPSALLVSDVRGWAFDQNMHDLAEHLASDFQFSHFYTSDWFERGDRPRWDSYDVIFECFHRNPPMGIPYRKAVGALRSEWFKPERQGPPEDDDVKLVNRYRAFQVAVRRNYDELVGRCPNVVYLTNPVNMRRFGVPTPQTKIVASWNGNAGHKAPDGRLIKHFHDVVIPACAQASVGLVAAEYGTPSGQRRRRQPSEMPAFYHQASVALCASEYEAASNSVMEAMASGLALLVTDVGNHREMRDAQLAAYGDTGIQLVDRSVAAFAEALRALTLERARQMGEVNRMEIIARWSWDAWRDRYRDFLMRAIDRPAIEIRPSPLYVGKLIKAEPPEPVAGAQGAPSFGYWNELEPKSFLEADWENPSRLWAAGKVADAVAVEHKSMVEVGPGSGVDYGRHFRKLVGAGRLSYTAFEGTKTFCDSLKVRFLESRWVCAPLQALPPKSFDVAYARHVLEHQPELQPGLHVLLAAARECVLIVWYRPPHTGAAMYEHDAVNDVHFHTFNRDVVVDAIGAAGWRIAEEVITPGDGNLCWELRRI